MKQIVSAFLLLCFSVLALADDMRPASLTITAVSDTNFDVIWKVPAKNNKRLKLDVIFDDDVINTSVKATQLTTIAFIEQWQITRADGIIGLSIHIDGLLDNSADILLRVIDTEQQTLTAVLNVDRQTFIVPDDIKPENTAIAYITLGVEHILIGLDHLLFVLCLIYISRTTKKLLLTITGFTIAHSITLIMAATGVVNIPIAPVEAVIALSIVFLAMEIAKNNDSSLSIRYPVLVSSSFGLLHGFGFASVLAEIGLPANEKIMALLCFNIGVEIGQLIFVGSVFFLFLCGKKCSHLITIERLRYLVSYGCGSVSMIWLIERLSLF